MSTTTFSPRMSREEAGLLAAPYKSHEDEAALIAGAAIREGDHTRANLRTIFRWKTGDRGRSRLDRNSDAEIADALRLAVLAQEPRSGIAVLTGLYGVDTPVASAIATVIHPTRYTIIDYRALHALGSDTIDRSIPFYLGYLTFCLSLAADWGMSLRELDRSLWQWSADHGRDGGQGCGV